MTAAGDARRSILGSIRLNLAASAPHDVVHAQRHQPPVPLRGIQLPILASPGGAAAIPVPAPALDALTLFRERLEAVAGSFTLARGSAEISAAIEQIVRSVGARRVAVSNSPRARPLVEAACEPAGIDVVVDASPGELFDCDVGISAAQWGIAETGTLMLESARERHRFVSLIPRVHIALLRGDRICGTLGEALALVRDGAAAGEVRSAAITLVTGPSRTSDIELTLAIGVHGPQELHVIVMETGEGEASTSVETSVPTPDRG